MPAEPDPLINFAKSFDYSLSNSRRTHARRVISGRRSQLHHEQSILAAQMQQLAAEDVRVFAERRPHQTHVPTLLSIPKTEPNHAPKLVPNCGHGIIFELTESKNHRRARLHNLMNTDGKRGRHLCADDIFLRLLSAEFVHRATKHGQLCKIKMVVWIP